MKAVDRYDPARGVAFSSYAVPTMVGEVQRHFRDHTWGVRPPRDLQERAQRVLAINRTLSAELGRPPTAREIAERLRLSLEDVVEALQACDARDTTSLDRPRVVGEENDTLADTIGGEDREYDRVDHAITADLLMAASRRARARDPPPALPRGPDAVADRRADRVQPDACLAARARRAGEARRRRRGPLERTRVEPDPGASNLWARTASPPHDIACMRP